MKREIHSIDAPGSAEIGAAGAAMFAADGVLLIRNLIEPAELEALRNETAEMIKRIEAGHIADTAFKIHKSSGQKVPYRIEYILAKSRAACRLLAHPYVLTSMRRMLGGSIVPTWDSMVFKTAGRGAAIPWHRDQRRGEITDPMIAINVDFYLDETTSDSSLMAIPGSHLWSDEQVDAFVAEHPDAGASKTNACHIPMQPGDVLLHNVFTLHGSPESQSQLRRVLYYEFRSLETERLWGPHNTSYVKKKLEILNHCQAMRTGRPIESEPEMRIPHEAYWRGDSAFVAGHLS